MEKHTYDDTNVIKTWHEVYRFADTDARDAISDCEDAITQNSAAIISLGGKIPESVVGDVDLTSSGLEKKVNGEWQHVGYPSSILNDGLVTGVSYNSQSNQLHVSKYGQANAEVLQLPNDVKDVSYDSASHALTFKFDGGLPDKVVTLPSNADITEGVVDDVSKSGDNLIISYVGDKQDKTIPLGIPTGDTGGKVDSVTYASGTNTTTVTNKDGTSNTFHVESGGRVDSLSYSGYSTNRLNYTTKPYTSSTATSSYVSLGEHVHDLSYNSSSNALTVTYTGGKSSNTISLGSGGSSDNSSLFKFSATTANPTGMYGVVQNYSNYSIVIASANFLASQSIKNQTITITGITLTHTNIYINTSPQILWRDHMFDYTGKFSGVGSLTFSSCTSNSITLNFSYNTDYAATTIQGYQTGTFAILFT